MEPEILKKWTFRVWGDAGMGPVAPNSTVGEAGPSSNNTRERSGEPDLATNTGLSGLHDVESLRGSWLAQMPMAVIQTFKLNLAYHMRKTASGRVCGT